MFKNYLLVGAAVFRQATLALVITMLTSAYSTAYADGGATATVAALAYLKAEASSAARQAGKWTISHGPYVQPNGDFGVTFRNRINVGPRGIFQQTSWVEVKGNFQTGKFDLEGRGNPIARNLVQFFEGHARRWVQQISWPERPRLEPVPQSPRTQQPRTQTVPDRRMVSVHRNVQNGRTYVYEAVVGANGILTVKRDQILLHRARLVGMHPYQGQDYILYRIDFTSDTAPLWALQATREQRYEIWFPRYGNGIARYTVNGGKSFVPEADVPPSGWVTLQ